jgi:hypothetical protein
MAGWTEDELAKIGGTDEIKVSSVRADGSLRRFVTIWVVRSGDELYVRSAYGPHAAWFRRARTSGVGRVQYAGVECDVTFEEPGPGIDEALNVAYHAKYDHYGQRLVAPVVSSEAARHTLRLVPRQTS